MKIVEIAARSGYFYSEPVEERFTYMSRDGTVASVTKSVDGVLERDGVKVLSCETVGGLQYVHTSADRFFGPEEKLFLMLPRNGKRVGDPSIVGSSARVIGCLELPVAGSWVAPSLRRKGIGMPLRDPEARHHTAVRERAVAGIQGSVDEARRRPRDNRLHEDW